MNVRMQRLFSLALKVAISATLLYFAIDWSNLGAIGRRLNDIKPWWMLLAVLALLVQVALGALRWQQIATRCDCALPKLRALRYSLIGAFFNQALPSTVGGDAARIWMLTRDGAPWARATDSVLIDRGIGLLVLAMLVLACLPWTLDMVQDPLGRLALLTIATGIVAGAAIFLTGARLARPWLDRWPPTRFLAEAAAITVRILTDWRAAASLALISFAVHLLSVIAAVLVARSVAASLEFGQALLLIPPVILIAAVPISIGGWGVRESAMVVAFSYAGLGRTDGLIVSVLFGIGSFAVGAIGGLVWITAANRRSAQTVEDDVVKR